MVSATLEHDVVAFATVGADALDFFFDGDKGQPEPDPAYGRRST